MKMEASLSVQEKQETESGIQGTDLKVATGIKPEVKTASGSYGEFLRVDLNGNYGGLGAANAAVKWDYYGNGNTVLATYGTKFAADNWMHKMMGIQLGLTESGRCKLPEGTDGTGYWILTVHALGYQDYVVKFQATAENIAKPAGDADSTPLKNIIAEAKALNEADYTPESWAAAKDSIANELEECEEMLANIKNQTTYGVEEQIGHLREALNMLVKAPSPTATPAQPTATPAPAQPTATPTPAQPTATPAPTATPTPTATPGITATAKASTIYTKGKTSTTITVEKTGVTGKAKFISSNKKVATVTSKGVVKAKKAGKTTITVKVGNYTKKVVIQVKKPSLKLAKSSATIKKGKTVKIKATATPSGKVTYKSSNKKVATVTAKGVVKGRRKVLQPSLLQVMEYLRNSK